MSFLFSIFAAFVLVGGIGVVVSRNPVTSAFSMVVSFLGLSALFIQLNAYLVGTMQILVYAGAIMVLFLFIIMLLDVQEEEKRRHPFAVIGGAVVIVAIFVTLLTRVLRDLDAGKTELAPLNVTAATPTDVHSIGTLLFSTYWFPVQVVGVLLLVATVGVVILSKREVR